MLQFCSARATAVLLLCLPLVSAGCGGTSQNDMRRYAIKRKKPSEDTEQVATNVAAADKAKSDQPQPKPEKPADQSPKAPRSPDAASAKSATDSRVVITHSPGLS